MFVGIETEYADIAETAAGFAPIGRPVLFGGVLDDFQAVINGKCKNWIHIYGQAVNMHNHYSFGAWSDSVFYLVSSHVPCFWIAIEQNGHRAGPQNGGSARNDREGRQYDLVACGKAECRNGRVEGGRSVADGNTVLASDMCGELLLESTYKWTFGRDPPGIYAFGEISHFVTIQQRLIYRHEVFHFFRLR